MSNIEQTKKDIDNWTNEQMRIERYVVLAKLAQDAGLEQEFAYIPGLHVKNMDYDKFMINVYAMAKIRELRRIGDKQ